MALLAAGCSAGTTTSGQGHIPKELVGRVASFEARVTLPKNATATDTLQRLRSEGVVGSDSDGDIRLEGAADPASGEAVLVVKEGESSKVRWIVQPNGVPTPSTLLVCIQGEGPTAVAVDLNLGDRCKE